MVIKLSRALWLSQIGTDWEKLRSDFGRALIMSPIVWTSSKQDALLNVLPSSQ